MADKLLIGVSAQEATVALWRGNRILECQVLPADESGLGAFRELLASLRDMPAYVMADAVEEDYRFESLPHAFGSDRAEMVARKLRQHYRNTPFATAWLLGRESGKRRDDRYLFCALTNPELVDEWLKAVAARGLPVAGLYLLPMVSAALPERLGVAAPNLLLVAQHSGGLRLTYFRDQQFRLSRLTRGEGARGEDRVRYFSEEISNTRLYLHALRTMTLDEPLTVLVLDRSDELAEVAAGVARENPSLDCVRLGRAELAARLRLPEPLLELSPYAIYLQLLGAQPPQGNLAPAAITVGHRRYRARRGIYLGAGGIALAGLLWSGVNLFQTMMLKSEEEDTARQTAEVSRQYLEITRQFPAAPTSAENLKRTVEIARKLRESVRTPEAMMQLVSRNLDHAPTIVIKEFAWKYGTSEIEAESAGGRSSAQGASLQPAELAPAGAGARKQSALIEGEIRPFRGDYRGAIETINAFAARLGREPAVAEVRAVKLPLNVNPALQLSGNTLDSPDQSATAQFKLLVVLKPNL